MARKPPYFPFYVKDFAADDKVESMTTEQVGAYLLLLCKAWHQEPPGSIPADDTVLARWSRLSPERWAEIKTGVLAAFTSGVDDRYHQKRMRSEYAKLQSTLQARSSAGKRGAEGRWQTHGIANGKGNANAMANGSGSESESESSEGVGGAGEGEPPKAAADAAGMADAWCFYLSRRKLGTPRDLPADMAREFAELIRLGHDPAALLAAVVDPGRDRGEHFWQFKERLTGKRKAVAETAEEVRAKHCKPRTMTNGRPGIAPPST